MQIIDAAKTYMQVPSVLVLEYLRIPKTSLILPHPLSPAAEISN